MRVWLAQFASPPLAPIVQAIDYDSVQLVLLGAGAAVMVIGFGVFIAFGITRGVFHRVIFGLDEEAHERRFYHRQWVDAERRESRDMRDRADAVRRGYDDTCVTCGAAFKVGMVPNSECPTCSGTSSGQSDDSDDAYVMGRDLTDRGVSETALRHRREAGVWEP